MKKINPEKVKKICVIQLKPFGDVFLTTSYLEAIKKKYPKVEITFLTKAPFHKVLRDHPFIDKLFIIPKSKGIQYAIDRVKSFIKMFLNRFDVVIDQQYMLSSQQLCIASMAKYRIGYKRGRNELPFAYNIHIEEYEGGNRYYSATGKFDIVKPLGIERQEYELYLSIKNEEQEKVDTWIRETVGNTPFVALSPGSTAVAKKWSPQGYAQVADSIAKEGYKIVLIWGPGEESDVAKVKEVMEEDAIIALPTTIPEVVALLKRAKLFITNDGGINHMSIVAKIPVIAIFGNTSPIPWSPALSFDTHYHFFNPNKKEGDVFWGISPDDVSDFALKLIK